MAIEAVQTQRHTIADLLALPDNDKRYELIDGAIIEVGTSSDKHAILGAWLVWVLYSYILTNQLGGRLKGADGTYRLDDANTRVPDVSYISAANAVNIPAGSIFTLFAPDFSIEIKSPSQSAAHLRRRTRQYLQAGSHLLWIIDFEDQSVLVYRPGHAVEQYAENDVLDAADVLPGFTLRLNEMFAVLAGL